MTRAYVLYTVGQNYIDNAKTLIEYLLKYSNYNIIMCYAEGNVEFDYDRLIKIRMYIPYLIDFNVPPHNPSDVRKHYLYSYKPDACELALSRKNIDEFVYLDCDVLPTPNIDSMFNEWSSQCIDYPLLSRYSTDEFYIEGRTLVLDKVLNLLNISRDKQSVVSLCAGMFFFNRKCASFIKEWKNFVHSQPFIDAFVKIDGMGNREMCQYTDEHAINALMWLHGYDRHIGPMVWTSLGKCVEFVLNLYIYPTPFIYHPHHNNTHGRTPAEHAFPYHVDASVFPINKRDLFAFHSIKSQDELKLGIHYIEQLY